MDNKDGVALPYASLSGGEKAYMIYVIMDMLNQLVGTNILFLDELSVIDNECFETLLDIILSHKEDYDHILIAAVDHEDTLKAVKDREIASLFDLMIRESLVA